MVVVEPTKKPDSASKAQELAAMEQALKNASEETRKQRLALSAGVDFQSLTQEGANSLTESRALLDLKKKQAEQQKALLNQLAEEEKQR